MAHYPRIYDGGGSGITDITFNNFFNSMTQSIGYPALSEGWYRIIDYKTTGYVLDRFWGREATYGCDMEADDVWTISGPEYNTPVEKLIVFVSIDKRSGFNRHQHRVFSELYPEDEIYWTWDFGIKWNMCPNRKDYPWNNSPITVSDTFRIEDRFDYDATLFSPNSSYDVPLQGLDDPAGVFYKQLDERAFFEWKHWRGYIYKRVDTERNIKGSYDWRHVFLARYSSQNTLTEPWNGATVYAPGDWVVGDDNWLYVSLLDQNDVNPVLYDSFNNPAAVDGTGGSLFAPGLGGTPTSAYAPLSTRRAWLRMWPSTYFWYSPWANGGNYHGKIFYIGNEQTDPNTNAIQPLTIAIPADEKPEYFRTFSGQWDGVSDMPYISNLTYIKNVDLGGPTWMPAGPEYRHHTAGKKGSKWYTQFDDNLGSQTSYQVTTTHPVDNYGKMSYVTDNLIVTFEQNRGKEGEWGYPDNHQLGNSQGGLVDGLKFGDNSGGNTFYVLPMNEEYRTKFWMELVNRVEGISSDIPRKKHYYGQGWMLLDTKQQIGGMELDTGEWTAIDIITPTWTNFDIESTQFGLREIEIWDESKFGANDFGSNFIGNVFFGALKFSDGNGKFNYGYPRVDSYDLSETVDGCFVGNTFKNSNRYNIFLHGMKNCTIDSSEASIIETAADLKVKYSSYNFLRDIYGMSMEESRYNTIYHAININSTGSMIHNYIDSIYSSTMEDGFWYNNVSMYNPVGAAYFNVPWPSNGSQNEEIKYVYKNGLYYESGFNHFGPGFSWNTIRGWAVSNDFRAQYTGNFRRDTDHGAWPWVDAPTYLEFNSFGESIHDNYIWNSVRCDYVPGAINSMNFYPGTARLMNSQFGKTIKPSVQYTGVDWIEFANEPLINFTDQYGQEQYQQWQSTSIVPDASAFGFGPTPYPDF